MKKEIIPLFLFICFAVTAGAQTLQVLRPNGGELWNIGSRQDITWSSSGLSGTVRINLIRAAGGTAGTIATVPVADGRFSWTVGTLASGPAPSGSYLIGLYVVSADIDDRSNAPFRIVQLGASQSPSHDAQPGQPGTLPDVRPGQSNPPDYSGVSGMPDMAIIEFAYDPTQHLIQCELKNVGMADYSGYIDARLEVADGGCWNQTKRLNLNHFAKGSIIVFKFAPCDFFPTQCGHPFRLIIEPKGPDERSANNVRDAVFYRFNSVNCIPVPPVRLEFSHGSKQLQCSYFAYNSTNTIYRNDILNDYDPETNTTQIRFVVGGKSCGNKSGLGQMRFRLFREVGSSEQEIIIPKVVSQRFDPGEEKRFEFSVNIPVRQGAHYAYVDRGEGCDIASVCKAAFIFADEFFD